MGCSRRRLGYNHITVRVGAEVIAIAIEKRVSVYIDRSVIVWKIRNESANRPIGIIGAPSVIAMMMISLMVTAGIVTPASTRSAPVGNAAASFDLGRSYSGSRYPGRPLNYA